MEASFYFLEPPHKKFPKWLLYAIGVVVLLIVFFLGKASAVELTASWYSKESLVKEGTWKNGERRMANGERFDENKLTCATRLYELGTYLQCTNLTNNKSVIVKVTDRIGKRFAKTRVDLSKRAFGELLSKGETLDKGLMRLKVEVVK
jgi:rare lipoprotein A